MANIFYGDVNGDGTFGTRDLTLIKSHINGVTTLSGDSFLRADINNDGRLNETNLNALNDILTKTVATSTYIDDEQITGVFKLKSTTNNFIISNIILNTDGSFTTLTTSTESDDRSGTYTLTVNFTYDTTINYKSNDGVILANTAYEVLSWDGIPLSRNWSVFDTTISSTGLFENFSGDISTSVTDTDKPTILKHTNFVNIFKGSSLTNYGNFDNWDKKGTTLVRMSGNLMANGFQIAGQMKIVDSSDETVIQWDSGYKGTYELDINPNILTDTFTIEMNDSVDVAIAVRNEGVIQKIEKNKSDVYKGTSNNISASGSITTVYKQTTGLLTRSSQSSNAAENAIKNIYDLTDVNDITKDFITEPNLNLCGLNQQIMTITKTLQILFSSDITDTTLISKAIGEIMVSEYNNPTGSGGTYNNLSNKDIIEDIVDKVLNYYNISSTSDTTKNNIILFLEMVNGIIDNKRTSMKKRTTLLSLLGDVLQLTSLVTTHVTNNSNDFQTLTFDTSINTTYLPSLESTFEDQDEIDNVDLHSLNLPEVRTTPWQDADYDDETFQGAVALYGSNYIQNEIAIALYGIVSNWDVSQMTNMGSLFSSTDFNSDISNWDVSNVTDMRYMFNRTSFNQDISKWDTSNVKDMEQMFGGNSSSVFNQNINTSVQQKADGSKYIAWDVSNVTNMRSMFTSSSTFNSDISNWNTSNVKSMSYMFRSATKFNQTIGEKAVDFSADGLGSYTAWNTENVTTMQSMFYGASKFNNGSIDSSTGEASSNPGPELYFDLSGLTTIHEMFRSASIFNSPIYRWDVSNISHGSGFYNMFYNCNKFEQEVRTWEMPSDKARSSMFKNICDVGDDGKPFGIKYASLGASETPPMLFFTLYSGGQETLTNGTTLTYTENPNRIITDNLKFDNDITNDTDGTIAQNNNTILSDVVDLYNASSSYVLSLTNSNDDYIFDEPNTWDVSQVTDMGSLFSSTDFDENIGDWNVSNVTDMRYMFNNAPFNQDISKWDTSNVKDMQQMFGGSNSQFNQNINTSVQTDSDGVKYIAWDVSNVTNMGYMFTSSSTFNSDISNWNTSNATTMHSMFRTATKFNKTIGEKAVDFSADGLGSYTAWNTENVTTMQGMFYQAYKFNNGSIDSSTGEASSNPGPELYFDLSSLTTIHEMFRSASIFNSPIYRWDVSNISHGSGFYNMFKQATNFDQEVRTWNLPSGIARSNMFDGVYTFITAGEDWNNESAQATPPVQFWDLYRDNNSKLYNEDITSTTIDGTETTSYTYTPLS